MTMFLDPKLEALRLINDPDYLRRKAAALEAMNRPGSRRNRERTARAAQLYAQASQIEAATR